LKTIHGSFATIRRIDGGGGCFERKAGRFS
jgi:hypothetical protein